MTSLRKRISDNRVSVFLFILFFGVYLFTAFVPKPKGLSATSGDEGHYLIMSYSMLHDKDLEVANNYKNADYRDWYPPPHLTAHMFAFEGKNYPLHQPGLSVMILPFFALAKQPGVVTFLAFLTALSMLNLKRILEYFLEPKFALITTLVVGLSAPIITYSALIYPEVMVVFLMSCIFRIILYPKFILNIKNALLLIVLLGLLPPQHIKFGLLIAMILLYITVQQWKKVSFKNLVIFNILAGIASASYLGWMYNFYGQDLAGPMRAMSGGNSFKAEYIFSGLLGSLIDRENGIFIFSPLYVYIFIGFHFFYKNFTKLSIPEKITRIFIGGMVLIQTVFVTSYPHLLGGQNPAGRYFLPIIPAIAIILGFSFQNLWKLKIQRVIMIIFAIYTIIISAVVAANPVLALPFGSGSNLVTFLLKDESVIVHKALPNLSKFDRQITLYDYQKGISIVSLIVLLSLVHLLRDPEEKVPALAKESKIKKNSPKKKKKKS